MQSNETGLRNTDSFVGTVQETHAQAVGLPLASDNRHPEAATTAAPIAVYRVRDGAVEEEGGEVSMVVPRQDQSDENWFSRHKLLTIGLCAGLIIAPFVGVGLYFAFRRQPGSSSELGTTTQTNSSPSSIGTVTNTMEQSSTLSTRSSGPHSSTDILPTKTTTTDKMTSAIEQSSTSSTRSSKPHSSTGAMSTMTTEKITSSTKKPVCAQQSGVLFPMEIDQLSDEVVSGQKTTIDNVFFGMKGSSLIKITGLQSGDQIYAFDGHKVASGPDRPVEITGYAKETDIAIIATSTGSRDLKITATNGDGEALTCQETVTVTPKSDAHVFYARTPAARAAARAAAAEAAAGVAAAG